MDNNRIKTSTYNVVNFIPLNLFSQISKPANVFFIFMAIMQMIKEISLTKGIPTVAISLVMIIVVSMVKDFFEDFKRWKSDAQENNAQTEVYSDGEFCPVWW